MNNLELNSDGYGESPTRQRDIVGLRQRSAIGGEVLFAGAVVRNFLGAYVIDVAAGGRTAGSAIRAALPATRAIAGQIVGAGAWSGGVVDDGAFADDCLRNFGIRLWGATQGRERGPERYETSN